MRIFAGALVLVSVLAIDRSVLRRCDVTFDGNPVVVVEGNEVEVPCKHAPGKTHRVHASPAKTYVFKGLGVQFEFDSAMNTHVDEAEFFSSVRLIHSSGSNFTVQVFSDTKGGDAFDRYEAGIKGYLTSTGAKAIFRKPEERTIAGEKMTGCILTFTLGGQECQTTLLWKTVGKGGRMVQFFRIGPDQETTEKAFATIERTLQFDPAPK